MKKLIIAYVLICFAQAASASQKIKLALNWKAEPQFGGFYEPNLAADFKKLGLDLEVIQGGSGTPTVQMLANDQVDIAIVSAEEILLNNDKNPDRKIVALYASFQTNPQIIMCRPENHFKTLAEVYHSKATVSLQNGLSYALYLKHKFPTSPAKFVPYLGGISNFLNDKNFCQQGFYTSEPLLVRAKGIEPEVFLVSQEGFNPYTTVVSIRANKVTQLPTEKIVLAIRSAWERYIQNSQATNFVMGELNKSMDADTFKASAEAQKKLVQSETNKAFKLGQMSQARWDELISQMKDLGLIKNNLKSSEQFYQSNSGLL